MKGTWADWGWRSKALLSAWDSLLSKGDHALCHVASYICIYVNISRGGKLRKVLHIQKSVFCSVQLPAGIRWPPLVFEPAAKHLPNFPSGLLRKKFETRFSLWKALMLLFWLVRGRVNERAQNTCSWSDPFSSIPSPSIPLVNCCLERHLSAAADVLLCQLPGLNHRLYTFLSLANSTINFFTSSLMAS